MVAMPKANCKQASTSRLPVAERRDGRDECTSEAVISAFAEILKQTPLKHLYGCSRRRGLAEYTSFCRPENRCLMSSPPYVVVPLTAPLSWRNVKPFLAPTPPRRHLIRSRGLEMATVGCNFTARSRAPNDALNCYGDKT